MFRQPITFASLCTSILPRRVSLPRPPTPNFFATEGRESHSRISPKSRHSKTLKRKFTLAWKRLTRAMRNRERNPYIPSEFIIVGGHIAKRSPGYTVIGESE